MNYQRALSVLEHVRQNYSEDDNFIFDTQKFQIVPETQTNGLTVYKVWYLEPLETSKSIWFFTSDEQNANLFYEDVMNGFKELSRLLSSFKVSE